MAAVPLLSSTTASRGARRAWRDTCGARRLGFIDRDLLKPPEPSQVQGTGLASPDVEGPADVAPQANADRVPMPPTKMVTVHRHNRTTLDPTGRRQTSAIHV